MAAADIYCNVGRNDEVGISARGDCAGATNVPRLDASVTTERCISGEKRAKDARETPTVPGPSRSAICDGESSFRQDNRILYEQEGEMEPRRLAALCTMRGCATRHEYECPGATAEVRKIGIRIPGHIRPSPTPLVSSPSNSFWTSQPPRDTPRSCRIYIRAMRFGLSLEPLRYAYGPLYSCRMLKFKYILR